jgi:hypothetical protein
VRRDSLQLVSTAYDEVHVREDFIVEEKGEALLDGGFCCLKNKQFQIGYQIILVSLENFLHASNQEVSNLSIVH